MWSHQRIVAAVFAMLVVGVVVGHGYAWASEPLSGPEQTALSILSAYSVAMTEDELDEVSGEWGQVLVGVAIGYVAHSVLDYYGVDEWLHETAIPAVESAVVSAYEATTEVLSRSFTMVGESIQEDPGSWVW